MSVAGGQVDSDSLKELAPVGQFTLNHGLGCRPEGLPHLQELLALVEAIGHDLNLHHGLFFITSGLLKVVSLSFLEIFSFRKEL